MKTLLVDGNWNLKRNFHKRKNYSAKGELCGGSFGFLESLKNVINRVLPDRIVVMWDGMDSGILRYDIYKPYKAKRKEYCRNEEHALQTNGQDSEKDKERFELIRQKLVINEFLNEFHIRHLEVREIEGDDLIAYYILASRIQDEEIIIYSRDQDYLQLVSKKVSILNPDNLELVTIENFKKIFGYTHENALLFKCFEGDNSDEIGGVNGVTTEKLLEYFPRMADEKYMYDRLVEECYDKKREKKIKFFDKIIEARRILYRNATLMNLKHPFVNEETKKEMVKIIYGKFDDERTINNAMTLFFRYGFNKFVGNEYLDLFFTPFYRIMNKEKEFKTNF